MSHQFRFELLIVVQSVNEEQVGLFDNDLKRVALVKHELPSFAADLRAGISHGHSKPVFLVEREESPSWKRQFLFPSR